MSRNSIDINCDLGEGFENDVLLLPYISTVNIACGTHAGSPETMMQLVGEAKARGMSIGAHPSYNDRQNFGRAAIDLTTAEIYSLVIYQMGALEAFCRINDSRLRHLKPHGALYNQAAVDPRIAKAICTAIKDFDARLLVYGLAGSLFLDIAGSMGLSTVSEVFADRSYTDDGRLTPRSEPGALITNSEAAVSQAMKLILENKVFSLSGKEINVQADSICLHGDAEHALSFAKALHQALQKQNISIHQYG